MGTVGPRLASNHRHQASLHFYFLCMTETHNVLTVLCNSTSSDMQNRNIETLDDGVYFVVII